MADKRYLRAKSGFLLPDGRQVRYGDLVAADDEMFKGKGRESLMASFEPVTDEVVEQATRAPGEVRVLPTRRPQRSSKGGQETQTGQGSQETKGSGQVQGGLKESGGDGK
ncbi:MULTISPECIES: hypothetical protein [unclassified Nonomuraea]|uniref:hypothetical protein n=1 Tax=unclassified Nonomuraea TaxID=2593643 RepID=UPI0033E554B1